MICDVCGGNVEVRDRSRSCGVEVLTELPFYAHVGVQDPGTPFHGAVVDGRHYPPGED